MKKAAVSSIMVSVILLAVSVMVEAQQPKKSPTDRIPYRGAPPPGHPGVDAFRRGVRDLGYIEGKNILVEYRYAEGTLDRIPGLVAELVQLKVDVLVTPVRAAIRAAKQATRRFPLSW